jgi:hypothetical protein
VILAPFRTLLLDRDTAFNLPQHDIRLRIKTRPQVTVT